MKCVTWELLSVTVCLQVHTWLMLSAEVIGVLLLYYVHAFTSQDVRLLLRAFIVYVRPVLEYNTVIWSSHTVHDTEAVESVLTDLGNFHTRKDCVVSICRVLN